MKTEIHRPWRNAPARAAALLLALVALATVAVAPSPAATGGAPTLASTKAQVGSGLAFTPLRWAGATWYGPGLYGNRTACGRVLRPGTMGVAHRSLPCGTMVKFAHRGRRVVTRVIDRGPFARGYTWDLTNGVRRALGFSGAGKIRYALALRYAKGASAARSGG